MTLPYTPVQAATRHVEEDGALAETLSGMPVVCCSSTASWRPSAWDGADASRTSSSAGALPVSLSDTVRTLKRAGLLEVAVAASPCTDGDVQAVTPASALAWCATQGFDVVICSIGPGIVGTGTLLGHGGIAAAVAANTATALGGRPILAVRMSEADRRERHLGVSHHARSSTCLGDVTIAWPQGLDAGLAGAARGGRRGGMA